MMLSRRIPRASPGARGSPTKNPSSSGPRCRIAAVIARTRDSASLLRDAKATPHMPHTLLFDLRGRKEGDSSAQVALAQVKAGDLQSVVGVPRKHRAHPLHSPPRIGEVELPVTQQFDHSDAPDFALGALLIASLDRKSVV